jgi:hypothetical protein
MNSPSQEQFSTPAPPFGPVVRERALWFGLLGGGVAWLIHFLAAYIIAEFGCISGWGKGTFMGVTGLAWLLLGVSAVMLGLCTWSVLIARRCLRDLRKAPFADRARVQSRIFMARAGFISGAIFVLIILVETLPIFFYLQRC